MLATYDEADNANLKTKAMEIYYEDSHYLVAIDEARNGSMRVRELHQMEDGSYIIYDSSFATKDYLKRLPQVCEQVAKEMLYKLKSYLV